MRSERNRDLLQKIRYGSYRNTGIQIQADCDKQHATITAIRAELTARDSTPHQTTPPRSRGPRVAPDPGIRSVAIAQDQLTTPLKPPEDIPGL